MNLNGQYKDDDTDEKVESTKIEIKHHLTFGELREIEEDERRNNEKTN